MLRVGSVQPLERFVGLVPESINFGDLVSINCLVLRNQLAQNGVGFFFPTQRVVRKCIYIQTHAALVLYSRDLRQSLLGPPLGDIYLAQKPMALPNIGS